MQELVCRVACSARLPHRLIKSSSLVVILLVLSACTSTNVRRADDLKADAKIGVGKSVVILEADVALSELLAGGVAEPRVAWTKSAQAHINNAIEADLKLRKVQLVERVEPKDNLEQIKQLELLTLAVGFSVVNYQLSPYGQLPTKRKSFDWEIGPNANVLKKAYGADYAIITLVRDSYASGGRKAVAVLGTIASIALGVGATVSTGQRLGYTMLVDLQTGKVVWVNFMASGTGDLRNADDAVKVVRDMLKGLPL
jgi:hypothetical protein